MSDENGGRLQSPTIGKLADALAKAQKAMKPPKKDKTARVFSKRTQKEFTYTYSDLADTIEAVREPFADNGLAFTQLVRRDALVSMLLHSSGEWIASEYRLSMQGTPQEQGSELSYVRRYALNALAGLASEDDDGAAASSKPERRDEPAPRERKPTKGEEKDRAEVAALVTQTVEITGQGEERVCRGASIYFPTGHDRASKQPTYEERWGELFPPAGAKSCATVGIMPSRLLPRVKAALLERQKRVEAEALDKGKAEDVQDIFGDEPAAAAAS